MLFAIKADEKDNVATLFSENSKAGDNVKVQDKNGGFFEIKLKEAIPYGHKIALCHIWGKEAVIKYGEVLGKTSREIEKGCHVHIHNLDSDRARGDLK